MSIALPSSRDEIENLIPHSGAMSLLTRVVSADETGLCCETVTHRDPENPLLENEILHPSAGVEYAAQAAALHAALCSTDQAPKEGVLAVASHVKWTVERLDLCQSVLRVQVTLAGEIPGGRRYEFTLKADHEDIVTGEVLLAI